MKSALRNSDEDVFELPKNIVELSDVADRLWYEFFVPLVPNTPQKKREILELYNTAVKQLNKLAGFTRHINITSSTRWIPNPSESGPDYQKKIFVEIKQFTPVTTVAKVVNMKKEIVKPSNAAPAAAVSKKAGPGGSIIEQILAHHVSGLSNKEIIALGFNKSTVGRQVGEFKKRNQN